MAVDPWSGHRNFGYDLVRFVRPRRMVELGAHWGVSFFAFCQAVKDAQLTTELVAVDTWQGDDHTGPYGDEVFTFFQNVVREKYAGLEIRLLRMLFCEARDSVADGSVDILHIDGCHNYEAVSEDFRAWVDKVREDGIVLLHDVAETSGYGTTRFWHEVRVQYPSFAFPHSWGLGVLFPKGERHYQALRENNLADRIELYRLKADLQLANIMLADTTRTAVQRYDCMERQSAMIKERDDANQRLEAMIRARDEANAAQTHMINARDETIAAQLRLIDERDTALASQRRLIDGRNETIAAQQRLIDDRDELVARQDGLIADRDKALAAQQKLIDERDVLIAEQDQLVAAHDAALAAQKKLIDERDELIAKQNVLVAARDEALAAQQKLIDERDALIAKQGDLVAERDTMITEQARLIATRVRRIEELEDQARAQESRRAALEQQLAAQANTIRQLSAELHELQGNLLRPGYCLRMTGRSLLRPLGRRS
ncbi:MAG: class I SAM-dependent methyltransferase [Planctomycetes bacterium]|nr:class I SAM-dependent methyltransferase [Planctomycetota bacterium]